MPVLAILVLILAAGYLAITRPCLSGHHRHRHLRRNNYRSW